MSIDKMTTDNLLWQTPQEIIEYAPDVDWLAKPWSAVGAITELTGTAKESGKTTFLMSMVRAILDGTEFLNEATKQAAVLYLSEENYVTLSETLKRAGIEQHDNLHILRWVETLAYDWPTIVQLAVDKAQAVGAKMLVIDTLPQWALRDGGDENDASSAIAAMRPLQKASATGLSIVTVRHTRKSGGTQAITGRGSGAWTATVDIVLTLSRKSGKTSPERILKALSRLDATPERNEICWTGKGYELNIKTQTEKHADKIAKLLTAEGVPEARIEKESGLARSMVTRALKILREEGRASFGGTGVKGDPKMWRKTKDLEFSNSSGSGENKC